MMFTSWLSRTTAERKLVRTHFAPGMPAPRHPAEPDIFSRQCAMPGHDQEAIERARVVLVGAGGLGSWIGVGLARLGIKHLTIFDGDSYDRTNLSRQLAFGRDLQQQKAHVLATNLLPHMTNPGRIVSVGSMFGEALACRLDNINLFIVGVDNNRARFAAARVALARGIPVIFAMLATDGLRARILLQRPGGACLSCVLPDLDPESAAPCAAASIASCLLAVGQVLGLAVAALSANQTIPSWREVSLDGSTERIAWPRRRATCQLCG
jgi:molybdopterin/thiamine biosynthesis adenylyltransferase